MAKTKQSPIHLLPRSFGFRPEESTHHFVVDIPRSASQQVRISEHLTWTEAEGSSPPSLGQRADGQVRVLLARPKWDLIAEAVRVEFNRRLKRMGLRAGSWRQGPNLVRRELGKELVLLAWAIEDADPGLVDRAVANWMGLYPEERWWLYTQTAAATGSATDRNIGWRAAVRLALTENPVSELQREHTGLPQFYRKALARDNPLLFEEPDEQDAGDS